MGVHLLDIVAFVWLLDSDSKDSFADYVDYTAKHYDWHSRRGVLCIPAFRTFLYNVSPKGKL